uniref:Uncharacterized protein n=1 Tax=Ditylenchus dipsaci TaxID=166011 RepID=A0A915E4X8_9BILA
MDIKPACRRPLVQLVPRKVPAAKPCNAAPPSTSSSIVSTGHCSSSDNESIEMDCSGGWPSTLSVLETPERRRLRRLRTNNTHNPVIQSLIDEEGNSLLLENTSFMSSPPMRPNMEHVFSPPTLKTPKAVPQRLKNVHISCSPMRSFYCRQSPTQKPRLSSNSGSSSGRVPLGRVNRVLKLPLPQVAAIDADLQHQLQQENLVSSSSSSVEWPREESGYASSSFNTSSRLEDLLSFDHSNGSHVETPSKGLGMDSETSLSEFGGMCSLDMIHHSSSTPLKHSSNLLLSLNDGFIPEQASGPLEASVLDGINPLLDNFFLLPPPVQSSSPAKHPSSHSLKRRLDDNNTHYATTSEWKEQTAKALKSL